MKIIRRGCGGLAWALVWAMAAAGVLAQTVPSGKPGGTPQKTAYYIDPRVLDLAAVVPEPPARGSATERAELAQLHAIERTRTPRQIAAAQADEAQESLFAYKAILGNAFVPEDLPVTTELGAHVKNEQGVAGAALKLVYQRVRPYRTDSTLHPVCELTDKPNSYPSGHALTGYLEAFTLAEIVPEKRREIVARADEYAHNRLICGVHYPSDIEASRRVAYAVFGYMMATPRFQHDLAAARAETRARLGMPGEQPTAGTVASASLR